MLTRPEILNRAAALIETYGKADGVYVDDDGCYCVLGAIRAVMFGSADADNMAGCGDPGWLQYADVVTWLGNRINATEPAFREHGSMVCSWSDRSSQEHVVAALRAAARAVT